MKYELAQKQIEMMHQMLMDRTNSVAEITHLKAENASLVREVVELKYFKEQA